MVGKIEVLKTKKTKIKDKSVNNNTETFDSTYKPEKEPNLVGKNISFNSKEEADPNVKNNQVEKPKSAMFLSRPKNTDDLDTNKSINSGSVSEEKFKLEKKPFDQNEQEVLRAKSKEISGPKLTGQVIDLEQFKKPKKKVASSSNPSGNKDTKRKEKELIRGHLMEARFQVINQQDTKVVIRGVNQKQLRLSPLKKRFKRKLLKPLIN